MRFLDGCALSRLHSLRSCLLEQAIDFFEEQIVLYHVLRFFPERDDVEVQRYNRQTRMQNRGSPTHFRVYATTDDHRRHCEEHRPKRRRKYFCLEDFRTLYELGSRRKAGDKILDLFSGSDEIKHRHALAQRDEKRREESEKDVLWERCFYDREAHQYRNDEANDGH